VADFIGMTNIVRGNAVAGAGSDGSGRVEVPFGTVHCRLEGGIRPGDPVDVLIRPENMVVSRARPDSRQNVWQAAVEAVTFLGEYQDATVRVSEQSLRIRVHPGLELEKGEQVYLELSAGRCSAIRGEQAQN